MESIKGIVVVGLGYVGLPLAVEFAKSYPVVGFDIKQKRVDELNSGVDCTREVPTEELQKVLRKDFKNLKTPGLRVTSDDSILHHLNCFIVTVPTPINDNKTPDLRPLLKASKTIGQQIKKGDLVIYESTVYPGVTEEECIPVIEKVSGLTFNTDFFAGYSPERINPGDKVNNFKNIVKVTSGSTPEIANIVDDLYNSVLSNGTHKASSIKVAEASKVIENAQRDLNISFVNELALIFDRLDIDTNEVIEAAGTKWNFLKFRPGLVGGHCISVDPYYLSYKAEQLGYNPQVIQSGRRVNDNMGRFVADKVVKLMIKKSMLIKDSHVLVMGVTFKENCPDIRNTKVIDIIKELKNFQCNVDVCDPWANPSEVKKKLGVTITSDPDSIYDSKYKAIILAVAHDQFKNYDLLRVKKTCNPIIYDIKGIWPREFVDGRL